KPALGQCASRIDPTHQGLSRKKNEALAQVIS
ncbi:MAG: hypothetical protein RL342_650, partial [Pseudomonadota bacterium]